LNYISRCNQWVILNIECSFLCHPDDSFGNIIIKLDVTNLKAAHT